MLTPLFDTRRLTLSSSQVVQSGSANFTSSHNLDLLDAGRKQRKNTLNPHAVGYFTHGEGLTVRIAVLTLNDYALKLLDSLLVSFSDLYVDIHRITRPKIRMFGSCFPLGLLYKC